MYFMPLEPTLGEEISMKESSRHRRSKYSEEFKQDAVALTEELRRKR